MNVNCFALQRISSRLIFLLKLLRACLRLFINFRFLYCFYWFRSLYVRFFTFIFRVALFFGDIRSSCLRSACIIDLFAFRLFRRIQLKSILYYCQRISFNSTVYTFLQHD